MGGVVTILQAVILDDRDIICNYNVHIYVQVSMFIYLLATVHTVCISHCTLHSRTMQIVSLKDT